MLTKDTKLRFWCQKVLPLVYDDSLSYYELLNKVVMHLNKHTEDINALIDFYDTFAEDVEAIIQQMMDDGDFNEIVADTLGSIVAEEYDPTESYIIFDYCIFESKLYRANGSTTGVFDPEKWDERTVGYDLATIQNYIYTLNAGNVAYDPTETYDNDTVGKEISGINTALTHKLNVYVTTTESNNGIPTNEEIISSMSLSDGADSFAVKFLLSNGTIAFTIIWSRLSMNYASGIGFGYYEYSGYSLLRYKITNGTLTIYDYFTEVNSSANITKQDIANYETTTTASRGYSVGEYVIVNNILYRVKNAINIGATFTIGTNIEQTTIGDNIEWSAVSLDLSGMASNITNRDCFCKKFGKVVFLNIDIAVSGSSNSSMGQILPVDCRPAANINAVMADGTGSDYVTVLINTQGIVTIYPKGSGYCQGSVTFIVD